MNESEIMVRYSNDNEGIIMLKDIIDLGVSKQYCLEFLKKNNYKRITRGLYIYTDLWIDYFYVLSFQFFLFLSEFRFFLYILYVMTYP